jgi:hypothetical protein
MTNFILKHGIKAQKEHLLSLNGCAPAIDVSKEKMHLAADGESNMLNCDPGNNAEVHAEPVFSEARLQIQQRSIVYHVCALNARCFMTWLSS